MATSVLLAEDHTLVRTGMRALLEGAPDLKVVGEAADGREAVHLAGQLSPDVVLMDVAMPSLNGIEAARQIHDVDPNIKVIMLSMHGDSQYIFEALKAGATGYVLKGAAFNELLTAIKTVQTGKNYLSPPLADLVMHDYVRRAQGDQEVDELGKLSGREREVLQLIAEGKSSLEVADLLHISVRTVDAHRANLMRKLKIHSIAGLTKFAIRHGLCSLT